ncbi:major paralogous domain-containing protein [Fibrobacter sp. UWH5]|nr:major paralogous domain-containing protein [Fibrobacter sp. UWH5]
MFSGVFACFWSVQHIACVYGTDDGLECDDDCLYDPVVDTVATLGDLPPCDYIGKNDDPTSEEWMEMWLFVTEDNGCENVGTSLKTDSLWSEYLKPSTNIVQGNEDALVGTNRYGFNAVPAGSYSYLEKSDELYLLGHLTRFWSNDNYRGKIMADSWVIDFWGDNFFDDESANPNWRISVRCVKNFE